MKIFSIVGARPQFVKLAKLARLLVSRDSGMDSAIEHRIVHTGQHYDPGMSDIFFEELEIPRADVCLGIGSGSHAVQTAKMLERIEEVLLEGGPDLVLVFGDTNSTLAGALAASKVNVPVAHVEAGLRSFNRRMPEEINRVVTDHVSRLLLAPSETAVGNLLREGLADRTELTGDIMLDMVLESMERIGTRREVLDRLGLVEKDYGVATVHRSENTDDPRRLRNVLDALNAVADTGLRLVFPAHPRLRRAIRESGHGWSPSERLSLIDPVGYLDMLCLVRHARVSLTDSGGLQKEAYFLDCPCVTLRDETEWVETVEGRANILTGVDARKILAAVDRWSALQARGEWPVRSPDESAFGKGDAAKRIVDSVVRFLKSGSG